MNYKEFHEKEREIIAELCSGRSEEVENACIRLNELRRVYENSLKNWLPPYEIKDNKKLSEVRK